jgi:N utilization substance protein B
MANRHLSRSIVLQTLFQWDFNNRHLESITTELKRNADEFAPGAGDDQYMENLLMGVIKEQEKLDNIIEKAAPDWPLDKIANVDRNVLRIGLYELLFGDRNEVPPKVAINEAIELAKSFGGESSGRFVNGVLGSVYREMGEPGKDQTSRKIKNIPYAMMPIEKLAGAVVYADNDGQFVFALVHDVFGRWTLSKGKLKDGEDHQMGLTRCIEEELGLGIEVEDHLGSNEYIANDPEQGKIRKQVEYYLARSQYGEIKLGESGGLTDAKWFKLPEVVALNFYNDILPIVTKAAEIVLKKEEK